MYKRNGALVSAAVVCLILATQMNLGQRAPQGSVPATPIENHSAVIQQYCVGCHGDTAPKAGLSLTTFDVAHPEAEIEISEKLIKKLRTGMMPPPGSRRPAPGAITALAEHLETAIDGRAASRIEPGRRLFQRLSRTEYANSVRDLFGIEVDMEGLLPPDTISDGFDNIADSQVFSPALMEGYIRAAERITLEALGDPLAEPTSATFKLNRTASQLRRVEGAPFGTRGGIVLTYNFPADGEYVFKMLLHGSPTGNLFGGRSFEGTEQIEVSIDGERIAVVDIDSNLSEGGPTGLTLSTEPIRVNAGPRRLAATFVQRTSLLVDDIITPIEHTLADTHIGIAREISTLPHLREFEVGGPFRVTGVSDTPGRQRVFKCRPLGAEEELGCATDIITDLATQAYRRPVTAEDLEGLTAFYEQARNEGDFETGIRTVVQAILSSPNFVFRLERTPDTVKPGETYRVSDLELASRLSYFLWATAPDDQLLSLATQGRLKDPAVIQAQVRRMLQDPRSESLSTKFAAMWLRLPDLMRLHPDALIYPGYDHTLAQSMKRETELFFDSIVREDRSVLDLLTATDTFVDERTSKHYGIAGVLGPKFRRVEVTDPNRRGLGILGHGSVLALTSVADRTSPVQRGKWVMEVLFGTPPPPPPPNVPQLTETKGTDNGKPLTVRERMEIHRANVACASCHRMIDPIGLALENFDVTGLWRTLDRGVSIDTNTELFDGVSVNSPAGLRDAIMGHSEAVVRNLTEKLMTYALGRRVEYYDMPVVRAIAREAATEDNRFSSFVLGIVNSPAFQMSRAETVVAER